MQSAWRFRQVAEEAHFSCDVHVRVDESLSDGCANENEAEEVV